MGGMPATHTDDRATEVARKVAGYLRDRGLDFACVLVGPHGPETPWLAARNWA